jgi:hypothetical protein
MHRATFFSKMVYESQKKLSAKNRSTFLKMSWDTHSTPDALGDLMKG